MSRAASKNLCRYQVGGLPMIDSIFQQMRLREILLEYIPDSGREAVPSVDVLKLLVINLTVAKDPLYELAHWVESLDLRAIGYPVRPSIRLTDDRFARALDKLYEADRASLTTRLVVSCLKSFEVQFTRIHSDSTTVKAFGLIPGRTRSGLELRHGHSKDHRPDLRQLVFQLSISHDGAVPVYHHVYPGNRNDDTTHIETWDRLCEIHGSSEFLYVADCKLCTQKQLTHIVSHEGHAITILPQNRTEVRSFKQALRDGPIAKRIIWRRPKPSDESQTESFALFEGAYQTNHGYSIYWFSSSEKCQRDRNSRQQRLEATEAALSDLLPKLNRCRLKTRIEIRRAAMAILKKYQVDSFFNLHIEIHIERRPHRCRGRPGKYPRYQLRRHTSYILDWSRNSEALLREARTDGVFPLLCTDPAISPKQVLQAYKFQPRLEKRFAQFKSIHRATPLLFKKISRVEANMFLFFISLMVQALLERLVRQRLKQKKHLPLKLYPEDRDAPHPTTSQILKTFDGLSSYVVTQNDRPIEHYRDELNDTHKAVLKLLDIDENTFWDSK